MQTKRILAIDGGGIKGVIPAAFLATVEVATGKRIIDHFDLIAGTSTGGIIALGLGLGLSATEILDFYEQKGPAIFGQTKFGPLRRLTRLMGRTLRKTRGIAVPRYSPRILKRALEGAFGDRRLGESQTRLVIPAFDRERREVHIFKTAHHPRLLVDFREFAVDVAMATASAPAYFPGHRLESAVSLVDGGVWANNPIAVAVTEAIGVLGWRPAEVAVLSLGCSEVPLRIPEKAGLVGLIPKMAEVFLLGQSHGACGMAKLLLGTGSPSESDRLQRYQHIAPEGLFALDKVEMIPKLRGIGVAMAREALPRLMPIFLSSAREPFVPSWCLR